MVADGPKRNDIGEIDGLGGHAMYEPLPFALGQLDRLMNFFPRNDGKAAFLFTFDIGLLNLFALNPRDV